MNNNDNNKDIVIKNDNNAVNADLDSLTERDWKFIKFKLQGLGTAESYRLSGFKGSSESAPYALYNSLKKRLAFIQEAEGIDKTRLLFEMKKILDMPLNEGKTSLSLTEKLKAIRLVGSFLADTKEPSHINISNFTINRFTKKDSVIETKEL